MSDLYREMLDRYAALGLPSAAHVDLTFRCPLHCRHCYLFQRTSPEMSTAQVVGLLDQLADLRVLFLVLSGGEVLLRTDLPEILRHARLRGFLVVLKTTGWGMTDAMLAVLEEVHPNLLETSFYAHQGTVHDRVTGVTGSFETSLRLGLWAQDKGIAFNAVVTLLSGYCEDAAELEQGLHDLGIRNIMFNIVRDSLCGTRDISLLRVGQDKLVKQTSVIDARGGERTRGLDLEAPLCGAARTSLYVGPDGTIYPCVNILKPAGRLGQRPLREIWFDSAVMTEVREVRWKDLKGCANCERKEFCPYCMGTSYVTTGELTHSVKELCEEAEAVESYLLQRERNRHG